MKVLFALAAFACLGLTSAARDAGAADDTSLETVLIESASTPAQHHALGNYFESKAADARAQAGQHRSMAKAYSGIKAADSAAMRAHCEKLATSYDAQAKEYDAMAAAEHKLGGM
jgi:hypothetical protein